MSRSYRLNRIASVAVLGLMGLAIVVGSRLVGDAAEKPEPPGEGVLVVANLRDESLTFIDIAAGNSTGTLILPGPPHEMVTSAGRLYITLGRANELVEVDPLGPAILRTMRLDGEPHGLAVDGDDLLVTLDRADALIRVDRASFSERTRTPTGTTPHAVAVHDGTAIVTYSRDDRVAAVAPGTAVTAQTGRLPETVAVSGITVLTGDADGGTVSLFALPGLQPAGRVATGGRPVRVIPIGPGKVAVALNDRSAVDVIDVGARRIDRTVAVAGHPDGLCLSPSGAYVGVASNEADEAQIFHLPEWSPVLTVTAGDGPGACLWIADR
jgi:hypothetical protein